MFQTRIGNIVTKDGDGLQGGKSFQMGQPSVGYPLRKPNRGDVRDGLKMNEFFIRKVSDYKTKSR